MPGHRVSRIRAKIDQRSERCWSPWCCFRWLRYGDEHEILAWRRRNHVPLQIARTQKHSQCKTVAVTWKYPLTCPQSSPTMPAMKDEQTEPSVWSHYRSEVEQVLGKRLPEESWLVLQSLPVAVGPELLWRV